MDVSVTTQLRSSRFSSSTWRCLSFRFFDRVVVQLHHRDRYTVQTVQKSVEILQVQFLDLGLTVQKTVEVPQVQPEK